MRNVILFSVIALVVPSAIAAADRLTDRDVKSLVERIDSGRDQFEGALDDKLKNDIVRGASGEVDVKRFLDDFEENVDRLKERLKPEYAASAEAAAVLRQATAIDAYFRQQPPGTRGESEWNRLATDLKALASAYNTTFPLAANAPIRRMGDREVAKGADDLAKSADRLKKSLDSDLKQDVSVDKASREAIVHQAEQLEKDAKVLRDRVKGGQPSSAETERVLAQASKLQSAIDSHKVPTSRNVWSGLTPGLQALAGAYGSAWPPPR